MRIIAALYLTQIAQPPKLCRCSYKFVYRAQPVSRKKLIYLHDFGFSKLKVPLLLQGFYAVIG